MERKRNKSNRSIILGSFVLGAIGLMMLVWFFPSEYFVILFLFVITLILTFLAAFLDPKCKKWVRYSYYAIAAIFLIQSIIGLIMTEERLNVARYCLYYGVIEVLLGGLGIFEGIILLEEKNWMGLLFIALGIGEIILGGMMCRERETTLRSHLTLISLVKLFEGIIKFGNEFVEEKIENQVKQ